MLVALFGAIAAVVAAAGTYLIARRKNSGTISSSDAETLWREAEQMRTTYREEAVQLRSEGVLLRTEVMGLREDVVVLRHETAELRKEAVKWREESEKCHEELRRLRLAEEK